MATTLRELLDLASKATPGDRILVPCDEHSAEVSCCHVTTEKADIAEHCDRDDAEFIAACSPATIRTIIESHERMREALKTIVPGPNSSDETDGALNAARDALAAAPE